MNANQIWAEASTITGSIGVFAIVPTFAKTLKKLDIHTDGVGTTPLSGALNLTRPLAKPVKTFLQAGVEHAYDLFVSKVANARHMQKSAVKKIAQGRVWSGADAAHIGLVDRLGDLTQAEAAAAQLAGLQPNHYAIQPMRSPSSWRSLVRQFLASHVRAAIEPAWLAQAIEQPALSWLRHGLNDPHGLYARCFCKLTSGVGTTPAKLGGQLH
jgi:protease-4